MIIELESNFGDAILLGKVSSIGQLKNRMAETLRAVGPREFIPAFCARYDFEAIPYERGIKWDYRMDLDVCKVFLPKSHISIEP